MLVRRQLAAVVAAALLALLPAAAALAATGATSSADVERILVDLVNQRRADAGVAALTQRADLHAVARDWSFAQAERGAIAHNENLGSQVCCWTRIAENVAQRGGLRDAGATTVARQLFALWRDSAPHDQTMVDGAVDQIGVGVVIDDDGTAWGTTVFRACDGTSCSGGDQGPAGDRTVSWAPPPEPSPAPEPEPAPAPAPKPSPTRARAPESAPAPEPTPTPSPTPAPSPSPVPAATPRPSPSPSPSPAPSPAPTPTEVAPLVAAAVHGEPSERGLDTGDLLVGIGSLAAIATTAVARRRRDA